MTGWVGAGLLTLVLVGCGSDLEVGDDGRNIGIEQIEARDLAVGDCFDGPASAEVRTVVVVPCSAPHDFEIYHVFELTDVDYPGSEALEDLWLQGCLPEFEPFVGTPFDESDLDISAIFPTRQSWDDLADREVLCSVTAVDETPRRSSAQGSGV